MGITAMIGAGIAAATTPAALAGAAVAGSMAMQGWSMAHQPKPPEIKFPDLKDPRNVEDEAQQAVKKRRSMYAGMGRSSTILTGPAGFRTSRGRSCGRTRGGKVCSACSCADGDERRHADLSLRFHGFVAVCHMFDQPGGEQ